MIILTISFVLGMFFGALGIWVWFGEPIDKI